MKKTFVASASELQSSPLFLQITAPMFLAEKANLNKAICTEAFVDDIIAHEADYKCLPLVADVQKLTAGKYTQLTHNFNPITQTFGNPSIGSFYSFEKKTLESGDVALIGTMRVYKRFPKVCAALSELFAEGNLKFSFELNAASYEARDDGTIVIDAAEDNYLEGLCVVSFPACPEAVATQLVAEILMPKDGDPMDTENKVTAEAETEEVKTTANEDADKETAELRVTQTHTEIDETEAHDWENDEHAYERTVHEVSVTSTAAQNADDAASTTETAEADEAKTAEAKVEEEKPTEETVVAEEAAPANEDEKLFASLVAKIDEMAAKLAELTRIVQAQEAEEKPVEQVIAEINESDVGEGETKMLAEIETAADEQSAIRRSLLEPAEKITQYTLL